VTPISLRSSAVKVTEDVLVDPVLAKRGLILVETEIAKPLADFHVCAPHGVVG